tara:strand:- start:1257 stop:1547 length:291 start_codon:yes stop_codon:yes gene_type:complete
MPEVKELTNKYIVFKQKDVHVEHEMYAVEIQFKSEKRRKEWEKSGSKYFVMKLDDEFNIAEITIKLQECLDRDRQYPAKIKGSDLSLIILNSICDK